MPTKPTATSNSSTTRKGALGVGRAVIGMAFATLLGMGVCFFAGGAAFAQDFADDHLTGANSFVVAELLNLRVAPTTEIELAGEHGMGAAAAALNVPTSRAPGVILWDEYSRKFTAPNVSQTNVQGSVSVGTRP